MISLSNSTASQLANYVSHFRHNFKRINSQKKYFHSFNFTKLADFSKKTILIVDCKRVMQMHKAKFYVILLHGTRGLTCNPGFEKFNFQYFSVFFGYKENYMKLSKLHHIRKKVYESKILIYLYFDKI